MDRCKGRYLFETTNATEGVDYDDRIMYAPGLTLICGGFNWHQNKFIRKSSKKPAPIYLYAYCVPLCSYLLGPDVFKYKRLERTHQKFIIEDELKLIYPESFTIVVNGKIFKVESIKGENGQQTIVKCITEPDPLPETKTKTGEFGISEGDSVPVKHLRKVLWDADLLNGDVPYDPPGNP